MSHSKREPFAIRHRIGALGISFDLILPSIGSWRLEILFYSPNCVIEDMYTDAVAVPTGYFRGVAAKRDRLSGVSLRAASWEPSHTTKLGRHDVRATAPSPSPVSHIRRCSRLKAIWPHLGPFTVSNPGRGRKPLIAQGKDLRGLLKSIIRLRLIVIGAPAAPPACLPVRVQHRRTSDEALTNLPTTHVAATSINMGSAPRPLVPAASRTVCHRLYSRWLQQVGGAGSPGRSTSPRAHLSVHSRGNTALLRGPKLGHVG